MTDTSAATPLDLHDIILPEPVSWMPQTSGWWAVLGLIGLALGWTVYVGVRRHRANRYRRLALVRLVLIEQALADPSSRPTALSELPVLVKQTALAYRRRSEVAGLSGERWLRFLDESYGGRGFMEGPGRLLPGLAYAAPQAERSEDQIGELVQLIRHWIRQHDSSIPKEARVRI